MKKILMIAVAIGIFSTVFSQMETGNAIKTFSIGPSIGFGATGIRNYGSDVFKPLVSTGVIVNYSTSEHIGLAGDLLWSREGGKISAREGGVDVTLEYIRVPLKFAYFFGAFENTFRPKITIGPSFGFLIDATRNIRTSGTYYDVDYLYNKFDMGVNASVGFNWKLRTNMWLNTDLNYYNGFVPIRGSEYNSNLGLKLGLAFGL